MGRCRRRHLLGARVPPGHSGLLKCCIDRPDNSLWSCYDDGVAKGLRAIGIITQGAHIFTGQEHTTTALINHALVTGGVPVNGDPWEAYIGAAGWTACGDRDAQVIVRASTTLGRRVARMALLIRAGGMAHRAELEADDEYNILLDRLPPMASQVPHAQSKANLAQPLPDADETGG